MAAVAIRGTTYPIVLPKLRDPRLHLAATITSLQVLGQVAFHFRLSIAQILLCLVTCGTIEVAIALRKQHVLMWPASALLTGNGVAFVLRVPGTAHGDWWTLRGWWIFVATAGGALLSKYVIQWRGDHVFNPSNIGLVVCFLVLGRTRADPLDFWWGPMTWWMVLALAIIVSGGFAILSRLKLLRVALAFWATFAVGIGVLAASGHALTARWHLGPLTGWHLWWVLVTSPEVLVFLFFMITDPKTAPRDPRARVLYAITLGALATTLIAPTTTEFSAKVGLLSALAIVCVAKFALERLPLRVDRPRLALAAAAGLAVFAAVVAFGQSTAPSAAAQALPAGRLPQITILPSPGVESQLDRRTAEVIAYNLLAAVPARTGEGLRIHLEPGGDQDPPTAVAQLGSATYRLRVGGDGTWALATPSQPQRLQAVPKSNALAGERLVDVAPTVGLGFQQGSFRYGVSNDYQAMMGGGVCWLDYNGDGWQDLFAVNSYASADTAQWEAHGGLPRSALFENSRGTFHDVTNAAHAGLAVQGDGCVAGDLNGDGHTDLVVTTTSGVDVLWNAGNGTFTESALRSTGWYTGAAVADVNGDARPDLFVAGYSDPGQPVKDAIAGFPTNLTGVRDLLYLNEGKGRFREVGGRAGIESAKFRHGLGAQFVDVNADGRPDLYVANDEDPNDLYVNVPWPGGVAADPSKLGFRYEERAGAAQVADPFAGMGVASDIRGGRLGLFVTNSRKEPSAAFRQQGAGSPTFASTRPDFDAALGVGFAGWGASWVDLQNSGNPDLVVTAGAIPVRNLATDAEPVRVLAPAARGYGDAAGILRPGTLRLNGRGLAAADAGNDGRTVVAVNTIGGNIALLRPQGPSGHWLDVALSRFSPGAVVTVALPDGRQLARTVQAGSSYLSSEDPRLHFGLGKATTVSRLTVRYPAGGLSVLTNVRADRIVTVVAPQVVPRPAPVPVSFRLTSCAPRPHAGSIATFWDATAAAVLGASNTSEPVQARDLFDVSAAMEAAFRATAHDGAAAQESAISFAAYRLLVWRASFGSNLGTSFALLAHALHARCLAPGFTTTAGRAPAAIGNRIAAAAIAAGDHDGSHEAIHYADTSYVPVNAPLAVGKPGTTVHDPTFWQPLALPQAAPLGVATVPAAVQAFVDPQWGAVSTFAAATARLRVPTQQLGYPSSVTYKRAAIATIRATADGAAAAVDTSPLGWNRIARTHAGGPLAADLRLYRTLNGALNDAAVAAWRSKRALQAPRPISIVRYLAFHGQSTDPKAAAYSSEGLPLVAGLTRLDRTAVEVRLRGRWVRGEDWVAPTPTPASPGGVAEASAFAYAADTVLSALTHGSFAAVAAQASNAALTGGIDTPGDLQAGRSIGRAVGRLALSVR